jgi:tRNA(Ile)-lysidine synthase
MLETYNPQFREAAWRAGKTLSADYELLNAAIEPIWKQAVLRQTGTYVSLDASLVHEQPAGVRAHLFRRAAQLLIPEHDTGYSDLQRAAAFVADEEQVRADFTGGLLLLREADVLYVTANEDGLPNDQWPQMSEGRDSISFSPPAHVMLSDGWQFTAERCKAAELESMQPWEKSDPFRAFLDAGSLPELLELRVRSAGDRFEPLGLGGHSQKLSDFFVNAKLPARGRGRWPLVCAGQAVIWVPGYRPAEPYRLRPDSVEVLRLAVIRPA